MYTVLHILRWKVSTGINSHFMGKCRTNSSSEDWKSTLTVQAVFVVSCLIGRSAWRDLQKISQNAPTYLIHLLKVMAAMVFDLKRCPRKCRSDIQQNI